MDTMQSRLDDLIAFHQVATGGSFTKAAEKGGTSKAMLSKQVKRLEVHLRSKLFHRTTRKISLTESGQALLNYSKQIVEISNQAGRRMNDMNEGSSGLLKITAPTGLGNFVFASFLPTIQKKLSRVSFEIDLSNDLRDFGESKIDFAIRLDETLHPDWIAKYIGRLRDVVCASPEFVKKNKIGNDPSVIEKLECVWRWDHDSWNHWTFHHDKRDVRVQAKGRYSTNFYGSSRLLAIAGLGIVKLPYYQVQDDLRNGTLVQLFSDYQLTSHPVYLAYLRNEYSTQKHKVVRDGILEWFKQRPEILA